MKTLEKRIAICFAYFGDDKFLGWYADSFGSIRENSPKIYGHSESQLATITKNFRYKLSELARESDLNLRNDVASALLNDSLNDDKTNLLQYDNIELRITECPHYDGPNPDFDKEAYEKELAEYKGKLEEGGIYDIPAPSKERSEAIDAIQEIHPRPKRNDWIYVDYKLVKEWASNEPTEFLGIITAS